MTQPDAIIIGAGIIGCTTAFELAKKGYKTLNIDMLGEAGAGSTVNSCAIVRAHYSTYDGVALAYENFFYWHDWENYLEVKDERGLAKLMNVGTLLFKTEGHNWRKVLEQYKAVGVKHEEWTPEQVRQRDQQDGLVDRDHQDAERRVRQRDPLVVATPSTLDLGCLEALLLDRHACSSCC